jgi:uncharacterized protein (DUF2384 family)
MAASPNIEVATPQAAIAQDPVPGPAEQLANYSRLVARVVDAFGDELKASRWLSLPNADLGGETPLQTAERDNYQGRAIEPLLIRIEHGIYY